MVIQVSRHVPGAVPALQLCAKLEPWPLDHPPLAAWEAVYLHTSDMRLSSRLSLRASVGMFCLILLYCYKILSFYIVIVYTVIVFILTNSIAGVGFVSPSRLLLNWIQICRNTVVQL